jgi:hypothetical protein
MQLHFQPARCLLMLFCVPRVQALTIAKQFFDANSEPFRHSQ